MFATSGSTSSSEEVDSSSASHAIASVPAAIMSLFVIVVHFVLIYLFKKRFVPNFSKCGDTVEKLVHVLVNTVVALPYDPVEKEDDIVAVKDNGRSRMSYPPLHRVTSFPPPNQRASTSRLLGDASDGVPIRPNLKQQVTRFGTNAQPLCPKISIIILTYQYHKLLIIATDCIIEFCVYCHHFAQLHHISHGQNIILVCSYFR